MSADIKGDVRSLIVPRKGVLEMNRILDDVDETLSVVVGQGFLRIDRERIVMTTKLIDGRFPDYEAVIPIETDQAVIVDRGQMSQALQRAAILSNEKYRGVRLDLDPGTIRVVARQPAAGRSGRGGRGRTPPSDKLKVGFNVNYLLDALSSIDGEKVRIALRDANSSCLVTAIDSDAIRQVVMPLKL